MKWQTWEATWKLTDNIGLFGKIAYCSIVDPDLREQKCRDGEGCQAEP